MTRRLTHVFVIPGPDEIARRIRAERERLGLNQSEAARMMEISRGTYRQLEEGDANPTLATLFELTTRLGMDPANIAPELFRR